MPLALLAALPWLVAMAAAPAASAAPAQGQQSRAAGPQSERIAAVVNQDVISRSDLTARLNLAMTATGLPDTPETRSRLVPQVLRSLIDERIQKQEARRYNVAVEPREIEAAMARIAQQNGMTPQALTDVFGKRGVSMRTLQDQIEATIAWSKLVQRRLRPSVQIGEDEIDAALERIKGNIGKPEFLVAEIFLGVDDPSQEEPVRRLIERLVEQIRGGASFPAVARQFSQAAGAANGGDLGWVQSGQLPEELDNALRSLRPGQVSAPIRSASGYHLLTLREQRVVSGGDSGQGRVTLKQVVFPLANPGERAATAQRAAKLAGGVKSCADFDKIMNEVGPRMSGTVGPARIADLPAEIRPLLASQPIGRSSPPLVNDRQVVLIAVCEREAPTGGSLPARDTVATTLGAQRLDMLQRRYLRDLRQSAFIEVRL